jgi:allantoinase
LDAMSRAVGLAAETRCALHIVHVSSTAGVALVSEAKRRGVNVTCETCPHYLRLTDADMERIGPLAKCAPPLRPVIEQEALREAVLQGEIDTIGSDHSPSPPQLKGGADFFKVWGGISSVQHTLSLLLSVAKLGSPQESGIFPLLARLLSFNVAERFALPRSKGRVETGCDADLALVDLEAQTEVRTEDLFYRHKQSQRLRGRVMRTLLRGETIFCDGKIVAKPAGRLVKPCR